MAQIKVISCEQRQQLGRLVDPRSVADSMPAYYALEHPCERTELYGYFPSPNTLSGFLTIAQTGLDLFRPVVVPFVANAEALRRLFTTALKPSRLYLLYIPVDQQEFIKNEFPHRPLQVTNLLRLDPRAFNPILNVMIVKTEAASGLPRFEIRSSVQGFAAAGINWMSSTAAEMYIEADEPGRRRGFTKSVLAALIEHLLSQNKNVLFRVADDDYDAFEDSFDLGFKPTGVRTLMAEIWKQGSTANNQEARQ
jgi:hypothetical protein